MEAALVSINRGMGKDNGGACIQWNKKNEIMPFLVTWMDLEIIILNKVRQGKTNITHHSYWNLT